MNSSMVTAKHSIDHHHPLLPPGGGRPGGGRNNPLKYVDPSGYRHKDFDNWEMNYFNSGASVIFNRPDIYTLDVPGSMGYTCVGNNVYIDRATGKTVDYETVFNNYIIPELNKQSENAESNETVTLYFPRQTPVLTNIYMPGATQWNIDGTTWYVFGYKTIYTSRTYEVGDVQGGGDWINTAIDHTGKTLGGVSLVNGGVITIAKEYVRQVAINNELAGIKNAKLPNAYNAAKGLSKKLGVVGGVIVVADVAYNSQVNTSDLISATMTGIAFTGWGAPIAALWFVADFGTGLMTGTTLSDRIDSSVGVPLLDWDY